MSGCITIDPHDHIVWIQCYCNKLADGVASVPSGPKLDNGWTGNRCGCLSMGSERNLVHCHQSWLGLLVRLACLHAAWI